MEIIDQYSLKRIKKPYILIFRLSKRNKNDDFANLAIEFRANLSMSGLVTQPDHDTQTQFRHV
jgi:hypothetical protein